MKREIEFRGKTENGTWMQGELVRTDIGLCITSYKDVDLDCCASFFVDSKFFGKITAYKLIPSTVGQYTGLKDIDRSKIYQDDIIMTEICLMVVVWIQITASFGAMPINHFRELIDRENIPTDNVYWFDNDIVDFGIYGNIHDNPHLINPIQ